MTDREAMRDAPAAIVAGEEEAAEAERLHRLDLVAGHHALRVALVSLRRRRLRRVPVAAQVGRDDVEALREPRRDLVPDRVRLRVAMEHQQRRAVALRTD